MIESPSPRRSGEKVPKADEGRSVESKAGPLTPASRTLSPLRRGEGSRRGECYRETSAPRAVHMLRMMRNSYLVYTVTSAEDPAGS